MQEGQFLPKVRAGRAVLTPTPSQCKGDGSSQPAAAPPALPAAATGSGAPQETKAPPAELIPRARRCLTAGKASLCSTPKARVPAQHGQCPSSSFRPRAAREGVEAGSGAVLGEVTELGPASCSVKHEGGTRGRLAPGKSAALRQPAPQQGGLAGPSSFGTAVRVRSLTPRELGETREKLCEAPHLRIPEQEAELLASVQSLQVQGQRVREGYLQPGFSFLARQLWHRALGARTTSCYWPVL